mmetsp:Transcript_26210/g.49800  ORF Transcript_26210/g.49800 Transcript_26210/m.49800 type:complete len:577 (-) Transcript_26210:333-2063(-)
MHGHLRDEEDALSQSSGSDHDQDNAQWAQREERLLNAELKQRQYLEAACAPRRRQPGTPGLMVEAETSKPKSVSRLDPVGAALFGAVLRTMPSSLRQKLRARDGATTLVLAVGLVLVCLGFALHLRQEVAYWEELESLVRQERQTRLQAQSQVLDVHRAATAQVRKYETQMAAMESSALNPPNDLPTAAPCPACPKSDCPPPDAHPLASLTDTTQSLDGQLEDWKPDFKVYVYDLPAQFNSELKSSQKRCINDQYGTEIMFHENLLTHSVRTLAPEEAEFFFVPIYGECFLFRENQQAGKEALKNTNRWFRSALSVVTQEHAWWNRTQGRDHVFVFAGARGAHIFQDWKKHIKKSIFLTPEGDRSLSEQFNTWKDIVIPGLENEKSLTTGKNRGAPGSARDVFAFFRGTIHNKGGASYSRGIRIKMQAALEDKPDVVFKEQEPSCNKQCYRDTMRRSLFCLCPRGWSPWTLRAYQAMMSGCIPVVLADEIEFPYESVLDWRALTVKIAEVDAEKTYAILKAIPEDAVKRKQEAIARVWRMVTWQTPTAPGDAFHAVLRELGRKRRNFKASTNTMWT